jgi:E3 ubiquitin-protein ligase RNF144
MDNVHERKSSSSSNHKWRLFTSCIPCITSKHSKKNISEGMEGNSSSTKLEEQILEDIFHDTEENILEGESSSSQLKQPYCAICMEDKYVKEMYENQNCSHSFCKDCVGSYLVAKIQENIANIKCPHPKCKVNLNPQHCTTIIPKDMFERWESTIVENLVLGSQKFYCPFKDCSALLVNDGKEVVTASECPNCHRLFCAQCKVSWHTGVNCKEFKKLKVGERESKDLMAMELAKNKNWKKCPKCRFYVERNEGCTRIICRYISFSFVKNSFFFLRVCYIIKCVSNDSNL